MTGTQKKIVANWCIVAAALATLPLWEGLMPAHWRVLKWAGLAVLLLVAAVKKDVPTRAERHAAFYQFLEEHAWVKIYMAVYSAIVSAGAFYVVSKQIPVADHIDFLFGALAGLFLPALIFRQWEAWHEADP